MHVTEEEPDCLSTSDVFLLAGKPVAKPLRVSDTNSVAR